MDDTRLWKLTDDAFRGYVWAMLWANAMCDVEDCEDRERGSDCDHSNDALATWDASDFSTEDWLHMSEDLGAMIESAGDDFWSYVDKRSADGFGHDFALTRNGHGVGFWDRGLGELGDRLTALAKSYGSQSVLVSESGVSLA